MNHFDAIIYQKQRIKEELLKNQNVVNLLCNKGRNVLEFENFKTGSKSPAADLIYTHFFIPGTVSDDRNFITMRSQVNYADTTVIKETTVIIYIICNHDNMSLLQGSRADMLANEVDNILNRSDALFGLGGIKLGICEEVKFTEGYYGWSIPYQTHVMNRKVENLD